MRKADEPVLRKAERSARRKRMKRRAVLWGEIQELVNINDLRRGETVALADALQLVLDRATAAMTVAGTMADDLPVEDFWVRYWDAQGNVRVEPNKWFKLEQSLRDEVRQIAADMARLGIAERAVAVEEQKASWILAAIRAAATDAGLSNEQVRLLGEGIRSRVLDGTPVPEGGVAA